MCNLNSFYGYGYWFGGRFPNNRHKWLGYDLPMLQVSRTIREEFRTILCSRGKFEIDYSCSNVVITRKDIPFLNDISNILLNLDTYLLSDDYHSLWETSDGSWDEQILSATKAEPISYFSGTSIKRNTCIITLDRCEPTGLTPLLSSPALHAMSQLTGFKTVQLKFCTHANNWLKQNTPQHIREAFHESGTCPGFDDLVLQTSCALEPSLGPFSITRGRWMSPHAFWDQRVTFRPREHRAHDGLKVYIQHSEDSGGGTDTSLTRVDQEIPSVMGNIHQFLIISPAQDAN